MNQNHWHSLKLCQGRQDVTIASLNIIRFESDLMMISLATAVTLTNLSKRTLWRRISDGTLSKSDDGNPDDKAKIHFEDIKPLLSIELEPEDVALIEPADSGNVQAQYELATVFLLQKQYENATYWLKLAAKKLPNAMYLLGRCYTDGNGVDKDLDLGMMWIAKAAAHGCIVAKNQMQSMRSKITSTS